MSAVPTQFNLDEREVIPCRLCRRPYRRITGSHLYWKHHIETEDYRTQFPNSPFFAEESKRDLSKAIIRVWKRLGRHWTKVRVRRTIRALNKRGLPLHAREVKEQHADLYTAALRLYPSWDLALADAGLSPQTIRRRRIWTEDELIAAIKTAAATGELRAGAYFRRNHAGMVQAAVQRWGSWSAGVAAAGLQPLRPPPVRWTRPEIVRQIHQRAKQGQSLLAADVHRHAPALRKAAERLFKKTWPEVIRELGHAYEGRERWSKPKIVKELQRLKRRGIKVNVQTVRRQSLALAQAAVRHFKTWAEALKAAGIDPDLHRHWSRKELIDLLRKLERRGKGSRRELRQISRPGRFQATSSLLKYWRSFDAAKRATKSER